MSKRKDIDMSKESLTWQSKVVDELIAKAKGKAEKKDLKKDLKLAKRDLKAVPSETPSEPPSVTPNVTPTEILLHKAVKYGKSKMKRIKISIPAKLEKMLEEKAKKYELTKAELIRMCLVMVLSQL